MQFTFAFLIKHIYLYFKFLVLKLFHANVLRDYLFIVHNVLKLCILANHKVVPQYYCEIYTMSHIVIIFNVRIQYQILEQRTFTFTVTTFVHYKIGHTRMVYHSSTIGFHPQYMRLNFKYELQKRSTPTGACHNSSLRLVIHKLVSQYYCNIYTMSITQ